jgi:DNA-dependent RNA polymerase auxiliary subunit epsilon
MNLEIGKLNGKMYQFFPLRTNITPKHIKFDTKSLIELLVEKDKNTYLHDIMKYKKEIWEEYFDLSNPIFKMKNYLFDHSISTDGYCASIQFIHKDLVGEEDKTKELKKEGRNKVREEMKDMDAEEKEKYRQNKIDKKAIKKKQKDDAFETLYLETSAKEKKKIAKKKKEENHIEIPYITTLSDEKLNEIKGNVIFCDPGKRDLLTMMDDDNKTFRYSNRQRLHETKRLKYVELLQNHKNRRGITETENELSDHNSKSCDLDEFKKYISKKNEINGKLFSEYRNEKFRQYKWYSYMNKQRSESKLLTAIETKFGKKNIVIGDWSASHQLGNFISTPNLSLKRKLSERFNVYHIDEYNTSKLYHKTETECSHFSYIDKKNHLRTLHSVLTFKLANKLEGCINRDINAVHNMKKLFNHWVEHKERPLKYTFKSLQPSTKPKNRKLIASKKIPVLNGKRISRPNVDKPKVQLQPSSNILKKDSQSKPSKKSPIKSILQPSLVTSSTLILPKKVTKKTRII